MKTIAPETETEAEESDFKPLTAEEAAVWRSRNPPISVWKVVAGQALVGVLVALVAWALTGSVPVGWSAAYGALAVVVPAALFARGVLRHSALLNPRAAMVCAYRPEDCSLTAPNGPPTTIAGRRSPLRFFG